MSKESEAKTRVIHRQPSAKSPGGSAGEGAIEFHCPKGHRIVVAAALAGKRGKCSKCGAVVEIPSAEALEVTPGVSIPDSAPEVTPPLAETGEFPIGVNAAEAGAPAADESWDFIGEPAESVHESVPWTTAGAAEEAVDAGHPTASLVARLWAERAHGGVIELHLANGSVILPEWYDANWSRGSHGLFASQSADGTVTLTAVAWDTVQKVIVRKLTAVPDDMFQ